MPQSSRVISKFKPSAQAGGQQKAPTFGTGAGLGKALADFIAKKTEQALALEEASFITDSVTSTHAEFTEKFLNAKNTVEPGAVGFANTLLSDFDSTAGITLEGAPTQESFEIARRAISQFRKQFQTNALEFELAERSSNHIRNLNNALNQASHTVGRDPALFDSSREVLITSLTRIVDQLDPKQFEKIKDRIDQTLAESAVRGIIEKDPVKALNVLKDKQFDEFLTPKQMGSLRQSALTKIGELSVIEQDSVTTAMGDNLASMENAGITAVELSEKRIKEAFGGERGVVAAKRYRKALEQARTLYSVGDSLKFANPKEADVLIEGLKPEGADFASELALQNAVKKKAITDFKLFLDDPAAYTSANSSDVGRLKALTADNPEKFKNFVSRSAALQRKKGLSAAKIRFLTNPERDSLVNQLQEEVPANLEERILAIKQQMDFELKVGDDTINPYNQLIVQLQEGDLSPLHAFALNYIGEPLFHQITNAIDIKPEDIKRILPDGTTMLDIETKVQAELDDYFTAVMASTPLGENLKHATMLARGVSLIALSMMATRKIDADDAVKQAAKDFIYDHYEIADKYVVPRKIGGVPIDTDLVIDYANNVISNIDLIRLHPVTGEPFDFAPLNSRFVPDSVISEEDRIEFMLDSGLNDDNFFWGVSENMSGLQLMLRLGGRHEGLVHPVVDKGGRTYSMNFSQAEAANLLDPRFGAGSRAESPLGGAGTGG